MASRRPRSPNRHPAKKRDQTVQVELKDADVQIKSFAGTGTVLIIAHPNDPERQSFSSNATRNQLVELRDAIEDILRATA